MLQTYQSPDEKRSEGIAFCIRIFFWVVCMKKIQ